MGHLLPWIAQESGARKLEIRGFPKIPEAPLQNQGRANKKAMSPKASLRYRCAREARAKF